jgi:uncharacterized protein (TIGR03067 family)
MIIRKGLAAVVLALLAPCAWGANEVPPAAAEDLARMQGDWIAIESKQNGIKHPPEDAQTLFRTISNDKFSVFRYSKKLSEGTFKIDPTQSPKTIDSRLASTPDGPPILGIYEFDGENLRICNAPPGKPRPKDFGCRIGSMQTLFVWERENATP